MAGLVGGRLAVNCDITCIPSFGGGRLAFDPCTIPSFHTLSHHSNLDLICTNVHQTMSAPAVDLKKPVQEPQTEKEVQKGLSDDACVLFSRSSFSRKRIRDQKLIQGWPCEYSLTKYTSAGQALGEVLKKLIPQITPGKKVLDLCIEYVLSTSFLKRWCGVSYTSRGRGRRRMKKG